MQRAVGTTSFGVLCRSIKRLEMWRKPSGSLVAVETQSTKPLRGIGVGGEIARLG